MLYVAPPSPFSATLLNNDGATDYQICRTYTCHTDAQGNVVAISDASGRVIETMKYDVYGRLTEVKEWNGSALAAINDANANGFIDASEYFAGSLTKNPYLFQGQRLDEETGLYYFKNRYYDPVHGRFISRDPAGMVDGPNLYAFVNNNPINFIDPLGLSWERPLSRSEAQANVLEIEEILGRLEGLVNYVREQIDAGTPLLRERVDQYNQGVETWYKVRDAYNDQKQHIEQLKSKYNTEFLKWAGNHALSLIPGVGALALQGSGTTLPITKGVDGRWAKVPGWLGKAGKAFRAVGKILGPAATLYQLHLMAEDSDAWVQHWQEVWVEEYSKLATMRADLEEGSKVLNNSYEEGLRPFLEAYKSIVALKIKYETLVAQGNTLLELNRKVASGEMPPFPPSGEGPQSGEPVSPAAVPNAPVPT